MNRFVKPTKNEQMMGKALVDCASDIDHICSFECGYKGGCKARTFPTGDRTPAGWIFRCTSDHLTYRPGEYHAQVRILNILRMEP